jgi:two-component system response regulator AtoC
VTLDTISAATPITKGIQMHRLATAPPEATPWVPELADEDLARQTAARLLITASAPGNAEALACRIHHASSRASSPFVHVRAVDFPCEPQMLRDTCLGLLDRAATGTLLISDIDELDPRIQEQLAELLQELEFGRAPSAAARLICCTRVSLLERIAAGRFSELLFYRLNTIHLIA